MDRKIRSINARDVNIGPDVFKTRYGKRYTRTTTYKRGYGRGPYKNAVLLKSGSGGGLFRWSKR